MTTSTSAQTKPPELIQVNIPFNLSQATSPFNCGMLVVGEFDGGHHHFFGKLAKDFKPSDAQWMAMLYNVIGMAARSIFFSERENQSALAFSATELAKWLELQGIEVGTAAGKYKSYTAYIPPAFMERMKTMFYNPYGGLTDAQIEAAYGKAATGHRATHKIVVGQTAGTVW